MHKHKRVLTSAIALLLCFVTLFTSAFAYTKQEATTGYPEPPTKGGGAGSGSSLTNCTDPVLIGYRFTCWRSTDWQVVQANGGSIQEIADAYKEHKEDGFQLGHSVNILLNAVTADGSRRSDYANGYGQTGVKSPHMLTNAEQTDYLNKIATAHDERDTDKSLGSNKLTHSVIANLLLLKYSGDTSGNLDDVENSSSFTFYKPLYQRIDVNTDDVEENPILSSVLEGAADAPVTIYSGYYSRNQWDTSYLNTSPDNEKEAYNLYTYIYGFQYSSQMGTSNAETVPSSIHKGTDKSDYLTISDIDFDDTSKVLPFNHNPANIINSSNPNSWTNRNHTLIATLCGLTPAYDKAAADCTTEEFGVYDYIIVEPIYMYYYFLTRYFATTTDTALLHADSQREKFNTSSGQCWYTVHYGDYMMFDICGKFPGSYGTYLYTETPYFGVDGVFNATTQNGYEKNAFTYKSDRYHIDHASLEGAMKKDAGYIVNPLTHSFVFTNSYGYTMYTGGLDKMSNQQRIWYSGRTHMFIAPQVPVQSLIGTGIFMSGASGDQTLKYQIVYHPNPNSGEMNNAGTKVQVISPDATSFSFWDYNTGINPEDAPSGKISTGYWTFTEGPNKQGIADNSINSVTSVFPNSQPKNGKVAANHTVQGTTAIEDFFSTYGKMNGTTVTVDVYAAWNTKSLVTTLNRTYDSTNVQTIQKALLNGGCFFGDTASERNKIPTAISVIQTDGSKTVKDVIQLQLDSSTGYQWFQATGETGNLSDPKSTYYIAYSFTKDSITDADKSAIQKSLNRTDVNGVLIYRNNGAPVVWGTNVNLFFFDFYTYDIEAPNCVINAQVRDYPDSDNKRNETANDVMNLILVRGSSIDYTVKPKSDLYSFDLGDFGWLNDWLITPIKSHIASSPNVKSAPSAMDDGLITANESAITNPSNEILTKHIDQYKVRTGKKIQVIPRLDFSPMVPYEEYYVDIVDVASNKTVRYSATNISGTIHIPDDQDGVVEHAITGDSIYYIYVSSTNMTGRNHMELVETVDTTKVAEGGVKKVTVDFFTTSVAIKTQSGGNHSSIGATISFATQTSGEAIASVECERVDAESGSNADSFCSVPKYSYASGIALKGMKVTIDRGADSDWYLTNVTLNGQNQTIKNDHYISKETVVGGSVPTKYTQTITNARNESKIENPQHFVYTAAPYHYVLFYLDDNLVELDTLLSNLPSNHSAHPYKTGASSSIDVLRGKYKNNISALGSIISENKVHQTGAADKITLNYDKDAVTYTTLHYYTVKTGADSGYTGTTIKSASGNSVGDVAYVLSKHTTTETYHACTSGSERTAEHDTQNTRVYGAEATKKETATYDSTTAKGRLTISGGNLTEAIKVNKNTETFKSGVTASFSAVKAPSDIFWTSVQNKYDLKFVFRINSVPYDSLPQTINNNISLNGVNQLTFNTETNGNVTAVGSVPAGKYNLYLNNVDTGMEYTVTTDTAKNVYYIDFYTLRVAAGVGIQGVSINPTDMGQNVWNGTLQYMRDGKKSPTTLAVWPASMTSTNSKIYIDATVAPDYTFNRWDTKRPTKNISITYANGLAATTPEKETYVVANKMNHATVVQAEATTEGTPIKIPSVIEHNSIYYGVKVRTFTDGRIINPWNGISTTMTLSPTETYTSKLAQGTASWATCLDLYEPITDEQIAAGKTHGDPVEDPYKGNSASATLAPSYDFEKNGAISSEYFYSSSNVYVPNNYTFIDGFYYTQTIQTRVNGVNKPPFDLNKYKEVSYRQYYKNSKVDTTAYVNVNTAGAYQVVMMRGMELDVYGRICASDSARKQMYNRFEIVKNHTYLVPYYTVTMKSVCDTNKTDITCPSLTFTYKDGASALNMRIEGNQPYVIMEGTYGIATKDNGSKHTDGCKAHNFMGWELGVNEIFILEYVDSGDGKQPYPVLTYTGESRASQSSLNGNQATTKVTITDETNLIARFGGANTYTLTLHAQVYDVNGNLITTGNSPISMYRGDDSGNKYSTLSGTTYKYTSGAKVNVSATLDPQTIYYPTKVSVTTKLACPACDAKFAYDSSVLTCPSCGYKLALADTTTADYAVAYYSTHDTSAKVSDLLFTASQMDDEKAAAYLAQNGVIVMNKTGTGTYAGTIPYADDYYHLYIPQGAQLMKQDSTYDVLNNKKTEFVWGAPTAGHTCRATNEKCTHICTDSSCPNKGGSLIWCGTPHVNSATQNANDTCNDICCQVHGSSCHGTHSSDFFVYMYENRVYTTVAHQVTTGSTPGNKSIEYLYCTIYTSTDYKQQLPYETTNVSINNTLIPLSNASGHNFIVARGAKLTLEAQVARNGGYKTVFDGAIPTSVASTSLKRKTFLLGYNTVTVMGDENLVVGIDGTSSQQETWLANYAIDDGALISANTTYGVFATGGNISNKVLYKLDSTVTLSSTSGYEMQMVAVAPSLNNTEEKLEGFAGTASKQYIYILENTENNRNLLDQYVITQNPAVDEQYVVGISTSPAIEGQKASRDNYITFRNDTVYDIIVDWNTMSVRVVAEAGTMFNAGYTTNSQYGTTADYVFNNVPDGEYAIYLNGNLLVTKQSDIISVSGTVKRAGAHIKVETTQMTVTSSGTEFKEWNVENIPGTAKTTYVAKEDADNFVSNEAKISGKVLDGTITYIATSKTGEGTVTGQDSGIAALTQVKTYKVETYVDDVKVTPEGLSKPVKFNDVKIDVINGEAENLVSVSFPTVKAAGNTHDTAYSEVYDVSPAITYDADTRTFKVYYYTVTFGVDPVDESLGSVIMPVGGLCTSENWAGAVIVAKGSPVTVDDRIFKVATHTRVASDKDLPEFIVNWIDWTLNDDESIPATITKPSHFIAHWSSTAPAWTVTLYNESNLYNKLFEFNSDANEFAMVNKYALYKTYMTQYQRKSPLYPTQASAPGTVQALYKHLGEGKLYADVEAPKRVGESNGTTNITLNFTGFGAEQKHLVVLENIKTQEKYICNVPAGQKTAVFQNVNTGYYQLYVDNIKYATQFSYDTHGTECEVFDQASGETSTPHYSTTESTGGIIYVAPKYVVRNFYVSHWSQVRNDRVNGNIEYSNLTTCTDATCSGYGEHQGHTFKNWTDLDSTMDPKSIAYFYICNVCDYGKEVNDFYAIQYSKWNNKKQTKCTNCGSEYIRMKYSRLLTPEITEDLDYYVYNGHTDTPHNPKEIKLDIEMAYPVYVQSVVDGNEQYPFYNSNNEKIKGASVYLEFSSDGKTWKSVSSEFSDDGLAVFYIPIGTQYRIVGAHADEWAMSRDQNNILNGGVSLSNPYTQAGLDVVYNSNNRYIVGDGDHDKDGVIDSPGIKYYVHYYTVTANAGNGIDDVNVHNNFNQTKYDVDALTAKATYQRGATAKVSAAIADGYLPVYIRLTKNNATYKNRIVYLSKSPTENTKTYQLIYNSETARYEHDSVFGTAEGTTYYVWANGKVVNKVEYDEYTGVSVLVKPFTAPVTWSGNCDSNCHDQNGVYDYDSICDSSCDNYRVNHVSLYNAPYLHSFTVYHTTVEKAEAKGNVVEYNYIYADDHPTDPDDPEHDPEDPDNDPDDYPNPELDKIPENTVYYYTLEVNGDAGIASVSGSGTYLEGAKPSVKANVKDSDKNLGRTPITVTLYLDNVLWSGQTVKIDGHIAKEIRTGVYKTDYHFESGRYAITVESADATLFYPEADKVYGYVTVSSAREYEWKAWTDGHVHCSICGAKGACCDTDGTPVSCNPTTKVYCTNCHLMLDENQQEQSCCTTIGQHNFIACPFDSPIYSGSCLHNINKAQTVKSNAITMKHNSELHAVTTYKDVFTIEGDTAIYCSILHIEGDAGVDSVYVENEKFEEAIVINKHGVTADLSDTVYHRDLPERLWTRSYNERTLFTEIVVPNGSYPLIKADTKAPVKNHFEAKTALSIELTLNGKPYLNRVVTIDGHIATDDDNDGIYVTSYTGFVGGKTYRVTVDGRSAGRIYLESYRSYRWLTWDELWTNANGDKETAHECLYHNTLHECGDCLSILEYFNESTGMYDNENVFQGLKHFTSTVARTEIIDEFHVYVDPNLDGGPDPYEPEPGDPDDPYKDPTDDDFTPGDPDIWEPGSDPEDQPNPEYDPDHTPKDNPEYDPVNPDKPVDPSDDPDDFDPNDPDDGFYEDAPIPFYTLTINTRLDDDPTDDFPVKFENLTTGETLYIIPDGDTYHVYDKDGNPLTDVPYIESTDDGSVVIVLQDGDKYRVSVLDEIEDTDGNDVIDINDIDTDNLNKYSYTTYEEGAIDGKPEVVNVDFYTLTLDIYSNDKHKMPDFGKQTNGTNNPFNNPVWLDDVVSANDASKDNHGDTDVKPVTDHRTVKVYLKGETYDVDVKTADDDNTGTNNKPGTGYLTNYRSEEVTGPVYIRVDYYSISVDHHGGFTETRITYNGKTHVSAVTPKGATSNAIAKAFFLRDSKVGIDAVMAKNNTWYRWTGTATYEHQNTTGILMDREREESAWAKTYYNVRYYLHDKHEDWYKVAEDCYQSTVLTIIDNRNWNSETVTGEPNKYVNFDPFRTHSFADPDVEHVAHLRDKVTKGVNTTTIDVVVDENQVGGQSFVDFYYTRNGSKNDPTPDKPTVPDPVPNPPESPKPNDPNPEEPSPPTPEDWDVDEEKEYVTITYVMNGGTYKGSGNNYSETHLAGTDITMITPTPPTGMEFVGWFLNDLDSTTQSASGLLGEAGDHYLLCKDTIVYAVYIGKLDLGITANDIYGDIKTNTQFMTSATIVNHNHLSVTPDNYVRAVLTIKSGSTVVDKIVLDRIIVPGNGTQLVWATVNTNGWNANQKYTITWSLDFNHADCVYVDRVDKNNQSALNEFKPGLGGIVTNTARPGFSTDRPATYDKTIQPSKTSNTKFSWEYWTWKENNKYDGEFKKQSGKDQMHIAIIMTPENESGLRTYTSGAYGIHNYTTRSGYGLSLHRLYSDLNNGTNPYKYEWPVNKSHITMNSITGKPEVIMTFPEFNYTSTYKSGNGSVQDYVTITASPAGSYYSLRLPEYADYTSDDINDKYAHYTPMWLPDGAYKPVTHISGMWTPIGELRATVQQGQYKDARDMDYYGIYTNEVVIKGSLYDDLYNNP